MNVKITAFLFLLSLYLLPNLVSEAREIQKVGPSFECNDSLQPFDAETCSGNGHYWDVIRILDLYMTDLYQYAVANSDEPDGVVERHHEWISSRDQYYDKGVGFFEGYFGPSYEGMDCGMRGHQRCYSSRIRRLWAEIDSPGKKEQLRDRMTEEYREYFGWNDPPEGRFEAFLYEKNALHYMDRIDNSEFKCVSYTESDFFQAPPEMVSKSVASITCGGTSHARIHLHLYCDTGSEFVPASSEPLGTWHDEDDENEALESLLSESPCGQIQG